MVTSSANTASRNTSHTSGLNALDWISLILMISGGLNWGLVGAFDVDLVATLFESAPAVARVIYILVGLAAIYGIVLLAKLGRRD